MGERARHLLLAYQLPAQVVLERRSVDGGLRQRGLDAGALGLELRDLLLEIANARAQRAQPVAPFGFGALLCPPFLCAVGTCPDRFRRRLLGAREPLGIIVEIAVEWRGATVRHQPERVGDAADEVP